MKRLTTIDAVIAALGGRVPAGRLVGVGPTAVSNWKKAGRIARNTYPIMMDALRRGDMTAPASLWGMKEARRRHRTSSA